GESPTKLYLITMHLESAATYARTPPAAGTLAATRARRRLSAKSCSKQSHNMDNNTFSFVVSRHGSHRFSSQLSILRIHASKEGVSGEEKSTLETRSSRIAENPSTAAEVLSALSHL